MAVHNVIQFLHPINSAGLRDQQDEDAECTDLIPLYVLNHLHELHLVDIISVPVNQALNHRAVLPNWV